MSSKFRNSQNQRYIKGLFYEISPSKESVIYTLKERDHAGYPSLYRLYMDESDITEYSFATKHLESWEHWQMICRAVWFQPIVEKWRAELEVKIRAAALNNIVKEAGNPQSKNAFTANKFLVERGWVDKNTKGRPSKAEVKKAAKEVAEETNAIEEAWQRLEMHGGPN